MLLELERQVVSRELAEKMKAKGFPQETYFVWKPLALAPKGISTLSWEIMHWHPRAPKDAIAAPTGAEILETLPRDRFGEDGQTFRFQLRPAWRQDPGWIARYYNDDENDEGLSADGLTAAEALGLLWLKVKEAP